MAIPSRSPRVKEVNGFCRVPRDGFRPGSAVLNVITLWSGKERQKFCNENLRWVHTLLAPYLDRLSARANSRRNTSGATGRLARIEFH